MTTGYAKTLLALFLGALLITFLAGGAAPLRAQGTTGALMGTLKNSSGELIPGATVTLTSASTGQAQTAASDEGGRYGFPALAPGDYEIKFFAMGFKTAQMSLVTVNVSDDTVVDAQLEPGSAGDPVACQCTVASTASSASGETVDSEEITAVPLTSRNVTQVLATTAGATAEANNAGLLGNRNQNVTVNGNTNGGNFTVDGISSNAAPNPDAITQFRIQTSQYDSGYGSKVPSNNIVTKSGSNDFHGALWEFVRNDIFNASAFFLNAKGQSKPNLKQNQFGGTIGGPIKKNKLLFFFSYQGTRQINGLDSSSLATMDLPPLTDDRSAAKIGTQFCPANHILTSGTGAGSPDPRYVSFAGGVQVACDGSNINPVALKILQLKMPDGTYALPTPQTIAADGLGSSSFSRPSLWNNGQYLFNIDYIINKKHNLAGRFFFDHVQQIRSFGAPGGPADTPFPPGNPQLYQPVTYVASVKLTSVLTSNLVNDVRVAYNTNHTVGTGPLFAASSLGMTPVDPLLDEAPELTVNGKLGQFRLLGNQGNELENSSTLFQVTDNISWIHGKHTFRTGVFFNTQTDEHFDLGPARGRLSFQTFADFLLGMSAAQNGSTSGLSNVDSVNANEGSGPHGEVHNRGRNSAAAAFLQDDFKVTSRLTLNLGLRWELDVPAYNPDGQLGTVWPDLIRQVPIPPAGGTYIGNTVAANYDPNTINPYTHLPFGPPPVGVVTRANKSLFQNSPPIANFAPRFGFAWQPGRSQKRLALRGGYGWFFQDSGGGMPPPAPPFNQGFSNSSSSNNLSTLQNPFPATTLGFRLRTPTSQLSDRIGGPELDLPKNHQWNLTAQFMISSAFNLDIGYVGSYGTRLSVNRGINQPLLASASSPVNCGYDPANPANCITTNTSKNAAQRVPVLGETPTALTYDRPIGHSFYNAMQATLRKQVSHGFGFQVSYTFSKALNDTSRYNDQNEPLHWSRTNGDRTHRVTFNYTYQFPNIVTNRFAATALNGWLLSGVTSIQSGSPLTLTDRSAGSVYGRSSTSTISLCPGKTYNDLLTSGKVQDRMGGQYSASGWINSSVICSAPAMGSDGSTGFGSAGQGIITGPGQNGWDISVGKAFLVGGLREEGTIQVRAEFYNAFNHPQFANPGTTFGNTSFGRITQTSVAPRLIQFGVKYLF